VSVRQRRMAGISVLGSVAYRRASEFADLRESAQMVALCKVRFGADGAGTRTIYLCS
jgi:hypothetical protein